jgi:hypothetical protein
MLLLLRPLVVAVLGAAPLWTSAAELRGAADVVDGDTSDHSVRLISGREHTVQCALVESFYLLALVRRELAARERGVAWIDRAVRAIGLWNVLERCTIRASKFDLGRDLSRESWRPK